MFTVSGARQGLALSLCATLSLSLAACGGSSGSSSSAPQPPALVAESFILESPATTAHTPGSPGVVVSNEKLITQFGSAEDVNFNRVRYTRYALNSQAGQQPDAILVAIPGTLGNAHNYWVMAENLIAQARDEFGLVVELWGVDRRSALLQDRYGLKLAEERKDVALALNFLFGDVLGMPLGDVLERRAVFYDSLDVPFMVEWTPQVHSIDIDQVINVARDTARGGNVFLAGHSAGTGFAARYASTDFNFSGEGEALPGYAKLRGLVLLEGQGGGLATSAPTDTQLDTLIAAADGGLYMLAANGQVPGFIQAPGLTPPVAASSEISGMQMAFEGTINGTQAILQQDQGGIPGNNAYEQIPDLSARDQPVTAGATIGLFMDDDNSDAPIFYAVSMGFVGPANDDGVVTWLDNDQDLPPQAFRDHGPAPTSLLTTPRHWGVEAEPSNLWRMVPSFFTGDTNFSDWYYPSTGLTVGNSNDVGVNLGLDTSALSLPAPEGRGRSDIVNQTQARAIDIPIIAFGGSNGLTPVPGIWTGFASAIAPCAAASCEEGAARMPTGQLPTDAFPEFGGAAGGFEVYISEGYSHMDVLTADNDATNNVINPLAAFIARNLQP